MTPSRYLVIQYGDAWTIKTSSRTVGPYSDHVHAIDAAIDFAERDSKAGRPAKVVVQDDARTLRTVWTYGRDRQATPQMVGSTGHIACHDDLLSDTERASGASNSGSPPFPELAEKNRSGIGLNLQELNRPQRSITNVANC